MTTLVFDTETSGFFDPKLSLDSPYQGRIIQLACMLLDDKFEIVNSFYSLIKPDQGIVINPGAQAAHGISIEMCESYGIDIRLALNVFDEMYYKADYHIAHNIKFDSQMVDTEQSILGMSVRDWNNGTHFCTMREMTPICQLPSSGKFGAKFKWPKLQEAYYHCFSKNFDDAHDAMADVKATAEVFKWLVDGGYIVLPKEITA